jgi:type II secretory pathway pseudopilin PulG
VKNVIVVIAICVAAIFGFAWYVDKQQQTQSDAAAKAMKDQTENFLRSQAHKFYSRMRLECAKLGGGLPCEQRALLDCRALYGDRCEGN